MIENSEQDKLWQRSLGYRDSGVITPGTYLALFGMKHNEKKLGAVPILECGSSCLTLATPSNLPTVAIDSQIPADVTRAFLLNEVMIESLQEIAVDTKCASYFCDCQDPRGSVNKGCGCYEVKSRQASVVILYHLKFKTKDGFTFTMKEFGSLKFTSMFITGCGKGKFPSCIRATALDGGDFENDQLNNLSIAIDTQIDFINGNGGFTVAGWYKRGAIIDGISSVSNKQEVDDNNVASDEINYHPVSIIPTCRDIEQHPTFKENKFNVGVFNGEIEY